MSSLRAELSGRPDAPTPYSILCPPGWQRLPAAVLTDDSSSTRALEAFRAAGRADLVVQLRAMLTRLKSGMEQRRVFEVYLPPAIDDIPLPAVLTVAPFVRPAGVTWEQSVRRLARGSEFEFDDSRMAPMWIIRRRDSLHDEHASLDSRHTVSIVPVPELDGVESGRALMFDFTSLMPPGDGDGGLADGLVATGEVIMATMRWLPHRSSVDS